MSYKQKILAVADGGTGNNSFTAYTPICGGTTSTGAWQSVASLGTAGWLLKSNGAGVLPSFQASSITALGMVFNIATTPASNIISNSTYYLATNLSTGSDTTNLTRTRFYIPVGSTITSVYGNANITGALGAGGNSTIDVFLNGATSTTVTNTLQLSSVDNPFSNNALNISCSAGDYFQIRLSTTALTSVPTNISIQVSIGLN